MNRIEWIVRIMTCRVCVQTSGKVCTPSCEKSIMRLCEWTCARVWLCHVLDVRVCVIIQRLSCVFVHLCVLLYNHWCVCVSMCVSLLPRWLCSEAGASEIWCQRWILIRDHCHIHRTHTHTHTLRHSRHPSWLTHLHLHMAELLIYTATVFPPCWYLQAAQVTAATLITRMSVTL